MHPSYNTLTLTCSARKGPFTRSGAVRTGVSVNVVVVFSEFDLYLRSVAETRASARSVNSPLVVVALDQIAINEQTSDHVA